MIKNDLQFRKKLGEFELARNIAAPNLSDLSEEPATGRSVFLPKEILNARRVLLFGMNMT